MSGKRLEKRIEELEIQSGIGSSAEQYVLRIIFGQGMQCKGDYREVRWLMAKDEDPKGRFVRVLEPGEIIGDEPSWLGADDIDPGDMGDQIKRYWDVINEEAKRRENAPPPNYDDIPYEEE